MKYKSSLIDRASGGLGKVVNFSHSPKTNYIKRQYKIKKAPTVKKISWKEFYKVLVFTYAQWWKPIPEAISKLLDNLKNSSYTTYNSFMKFALKSYLSVDYHIDETGQAWWDFTWLIPPGYNDLWISYIDNETYNSTVFCLDDFEKGSEQTHSYATDSTGIQNFGIFDDELAEDFFSTYPLAGLITRWKRVDTESYPLIAQVNIPEIITADIDCSFHADLWFYSIEGWNEAHEALTAQSNEQELLAIGVFYNGDFEIDRGALIFDTSEIPPEANIISAKLKFWMDAIYDDDITHLQVYRNQNWEYPTAPPVLNDYNIYLYPLLIGNIALSEIIIDWNEIPLSTTQAINKGGFTRYILINSRDFENNPPTGWNICWTYDMTHPPSLHIKYTL